MLHPDHDFLGLDEMSPISMTMFHAYPFTTMLAMFAVAVLLSPRFPVLLHVDMVIAL